jgi:hypothetical protein
LGPQKSGPQKALYQNGSLKIWSQRKRVDFYPFKELMSDKPASLFVVRCCFSNLRFQSKLATKCK